MTINISRSETWISNSNEFDETPECRCMCVRACMHAFAWGSGGVVAWTLSELCPCKIKNLINMKCPGTITGAADKKLNSCLI